MREESMAQEKILLEKFLLQNEEIEKLESLLAEFNVFEILESVNVEIRHSNVLAWLMNPKSNHGFGDQFLRLFLKHLFANNRERIKSEVTFFDIEVFNLDDIEIRREWNRIDLLIISESNKLVVTIENKIETTEHDNQLQRYYDIVTQEFPGYRKLFIYLTPESLTPNDKDNWIIFDYSTIHLVLKRLLELRKSSLSDSVYDFLNQYCTILRRYIMPGSEIEDICRKIYQKHQKALDLIFQYKPDIELEVSEIIQDIIKKHNELILDSEAKTFIRFTSQKLDNLIPKKGEGKVWVSSNRILLFEFSNYEKKGVLKLCIGPGDNQIREKLHNIVMKDTKLFNKSKRKLGSKYLTIYQKEYLKPNNYEESDAVELKEIISKKFDSFMIDDLPNIEKHITNHWYSA